MLSIWIIALFVIVFMRDALPGAGSYDRAPHAMSMVGASEPASGLTSLLAPGSPWVWGLGLLPYLAIAFIVQVVLLAAAREIDRSGSRRALLLADRTVALSRTLVVGVHFGNVMLLGWLTSARAVIGDVILLDELICIVPPILVFVAGWFSAYAIDRRLRDAAMFRTVESGRTVYAPPTRAQFVVSNARNMLALPLAPLIFLAAWSEVGDRALNRLAAMKFQPGPLGDLSRWINSGPNAEYAKIVLQLLGVALVMALAPLAVRVLWDTVRMSSGVMRDRLLAMCKASRVRVNEILIWRTHGTMTNGAVVGLSGRLRYVLLTDALLDAMPTRQVEAVMAHEIAHARHAHIPWLALTFLSAFGSIAVLASITWHGALELAGVRVDPVAAEQSLQVMGRGEPDSGPQSVQVSAPDLMTAMYLLAGDAMITVGSLIGGVLVLGFVSRRFEWQADAFAAKSLSTLGPARLELDASAMAQTAALREYAEHGLGPSDASSSATTDISHAPSNSTPIVSLRGGITILSDGVLPGADAPRTSPPSASSLPASQRMSDAPSRPEVPRHRETPQSDAVDDPSPETQVVRRAAVDAMAEALQTVAAVNAIPRHRASFRHGSIAQRQRKLRELVGLPLDALPIDRTVRWIKRAAAMALVSLVVLVVLGN